MRKALAVLGIFIATAVAAYTQDDAEWYRNKPIADIQFVGLNTVSEQELEGIVEPFIDEDFTDTLFWDLQSKLYALDYFEHIEANALPANDERSEVIIEFTVTERPVVDRIEFSGNSRIRRPDLLDNILLKAGDMVTTTKLRADAEAVRSLYLERGYPEAEVETSTRDVDDTGRVAVVFEIEEGKQTTITDISFVGNDFVSASTLRGIIKTKAQSLFNSGVFQESRIREDIDAIESYYQDRGFIDAEVTDVNRQLTQEEERNELALTFYIEEGEQYTYDGLSFEGNEIFTTQELQNQVRQKPGTTLNRTKLETDYQRVIDLYLESGYIYNGFARDEVRDEQENVISYEITIVERPRAHIENIIFRGNEKTKDYVLRRELPFQEGDIFSKSKLEQGLQNLYRLGYFSVVSPQPVEGSAEGLMDLIINVEETGTADIQFAIQFGGTDFPVTGKVGLADRNFLGRGQTLGAELNVSPVSQQLSFNFLENWLFEQRWSAGFDFTFDHSLSQGIRQDLLAPVFLPGDTNPVPDPFDGHYVFSDEREYPTGSGTTVSAGTSFPGVPTEEDIEEYSLMTDYEYAVQNGNGIPDQYLMSYDSFDFSLGLNTGYRFSTQAGMIGSSTGVRSTLTFLSYDPNLYRPFESDVRDNLGKWRFVNKWWGNASIDGRDNIINPSSGYYVAQRLTLTGGFLQGTRDFIRSDTKVEGFLPLFDIPVFEGWSWKMILAGHSALSVILPQFDGSFAASSNDLLYIDGMLIARGWPQRLWGEALWDNWVELRMPLVPGILSWDFFLDGVALWDNPPAPKDVELEDFVFSTGAGLRFPIQQFPLRFYLAKRFSFDDGKIRWEQDEIFPESLGLKFVFALGVELW